MTIKAVVEINGIRQNTNYFVLPKNNTEKFMIDFPYVIHETHYDWISNNFKTDLFLDTGLKKYTFYGCVPSSVITGKNRLGIDSRTVYISFEVMLFGIIRREHA